jgi:hypothetical protein
MNPLLSRLASLRRKVRLLDGWQGVCALLGLVVGAVLVAGMLDWFVQLPSLVRGLLLVGILAGAGMVAYRFLFRPLSSPCDNLTLALRVEEAFPELNDALGSTVQFLSESADAPGAAASSQDMRKKAVQQATAKAEQYDFSRIISYRPAIVLGVSLLALVAVAAHFAYRHAEFSGIALARLADPFGGHTWTSVDVPKAPTKVAVAQPLAVKAVFTGVIPQRVRLEIMDQRPGQEQQPPEQKNIDLKAGAESLVIPWDVTKYNRDFKFRVTANDGSFPPAGKWHFVKVVEPPKLVPFDGQPSPQIEVFPPAYTEEPSPQKLTPGSKMIKAWAGSAIVFRAATDRAVKTVWFEYRPRNIQLGPPVPALRASTLFSQLATGSPLAALGDLFVGQTIWERVPAELDTDGTRFTVRFTAWTPGVCVLHLEDADKLPHDYPFELDVDLDPPPNVKLVQPAINVTLLPDAEVAFKFRAEDDTFALRSVFVEYEVRRGPDDKVGSGLKRAVLKLAPGYEKGLPHLSAPLVFSATPATDALKDKPKRVEVVSTWALRNQFQIGDSVKVQVRADDYCDVYGVRVPGESHAITLMIVGKAELNKVIDDKLKQVQQDLKAVMKTQEAAHDIVKDVQTKDKVTPKDVERIVEAEQMQSTIKEKIDDADDGLRKQIEKLQQLLKDNKMKDSEAQLQAGMIKGALDQLARQELPQIDQALADARKQLAQDASKDPKDNKDKQGPKDNKGPDPKKKRDPLSKSEKLQASTLKNLKELEQALAPWADMQDVKETVRSILEQQQQIKKELDTVKADKQKFDDTNPSPDEKLEKDKEFKDQLQKDAGRLADLSQRAEQLKKQLDDMEKKRRDNDKENADRLKEASKIADKADLATRMKETAKELKNTADNPRKDPVPSNQAQQQQQQNIKNLEKMLDALDGKDDAADRLRKKQNKQAQEKVEELVKENQDLKKQVKDANEKLKDDDEKLKSKREELGKKFEELQQKLEDEARELARLQEPRAAKDVEQAAQEAGEAARKLKNNQDAGDEEKNAEQKLKQAKQDLKDSEDELAREQLARIADKLKALKERQDEAIDRGKEFTKRLLARKTWNDALGRSLEADTTAQEGLAKEVRSLKEKLKEARVFEHIMERSAKSMDEAVGVMRDRKQQGMAQGQVDLKAGQMQDEDQLEFDSQKSKETLKHQTQAGERLQRLLDSIKEELAKKPPEKKQDAAKEGDPEQPPDGPKARPGDGIPPMAQLKALRAEQIDLNERTDEFTRRNPDTMKLNAEQRRGLEQLQLDQRNLQELFLQMTAMPEMKGDAP